MKKIRNLLVMLLLFTGLAMSQEEGTYGYSQEMYLTTSTDIYAFDVDVELIPYAQEFFRHQELDSVDLCMMENLIGIVYFPDMEIFGVGDAWGVTRVFEDGRAIILLNDDIPRYLPTLISAVLYHELYHWIGQTGEHCGDCSFILAPVVNDVERVVREFDIAEKKKVIQAILEKQN